MSQISDPFAFVALFDCSEGQKDHLQKTHLGSIFEAELAAAAPESSPEEPPLKPPASSPRHVVVSGNTS